MDVTVFPLLDVFIIVGGENVVKKNRSTKDRCKI